MRESTGRPESEGMERGRQELNKRLVEAHGEEWK